MELNQLIESGKGIVKEGRGEGAMEMEWDVIYLCVCVCVVSFDRY